MPGAHRLWLSKLMQSLLCCNDIIKLLVAKIIGRMDKKMSCCKVGAFRQLFFAKEQRKALKGKPDRNL